MVAAHAPRGADSDREKLHSMTLRFRALLAATDVEVPPESFGPIVPVLLGDNERALRVSAHLSARGILTQAIRPPTVPPGSARLRVTLNAAMSNATVDRLAREIISACAAS